MGEIGAGAAVLPELEALRGVEQNRFHHTDVYEHTLEMLDWTVTLGSGRDPAQPRAAAAARTRTEGSAASARSLLREPLADELPRARRCAGARCCTTRQSHSRAAVAARRR